MAHFLPLPIPDSGKKDMVRLSDLSVAPVEEKKKYLFQTTKQGGPKKEWHLERERRKQRAQKKEQRRKNMDEQKESEKGKWKSFTAKASAKNMKVGGGGRDWGSSGHISPLIRASSTSQCPAPPAMGPGEREAHAAPAPPWTCPRAGTPRRSAPHNGGTWSPSFNER
jgi:hypothetical protein